MRVTCHHEGYKISDKSASASLRVLHLQPVFSLTILPVHKDLFV